MAFGMKYWIGAVVAGLALVSVWRLPPAAFESHLAVELSHEEARARALSGELRRAHFTLQRHRWADSLATVIVAGGAERIALLFPVGHELGADALAGAQERIAEAEATLAEQRSDVALGFVYQYWDHAAYPGVRMDPRMGTGTFVGSRDGVDYCFRIHSVREGRLEMAVLDDLRLGAFWQTDHLGPCRFYGRYGPPGRDVVRWLEQGGIDFALAHKARGEPLDRRARRRGLFGVTYFGRAEKPIYVRCLAGVADACRRVFLTPGEVDEEVAQRQETALRAGAISTSVQWTFSGQGPFILADLERAFGREKFDLFWTSDAPVDQAFEAAFGIEPGAWIVRWLETSMILQMPGPGLPQSSSSGSLLTIALFAGIAFLRNRRRNVL